MARTFDSLSNEVQQIIFEILQQHPSDKFDRQSSDIRECMLVCKKWKILSQKFLYSNVYLCDFAAVREFLNAIEKNQHLHGFVKKLFFSYDYDGENDYENAVIAKLFTFFPNIEYIDGYCRGIYSFLLDALFNNHLRKLKYINGPVNSRDSNDYYACTVPIKDRLKNLIITELDDDNDVEEEVADNDWEEHFIRTRREASTQFYTYFNMIDQFKRLNQLSIRRRSGNIIELIEKVTPHCLTFKKLEMDIRIEEEDEGSSTIDANNITSSNCSPLFDVHRLRFSGDLFYDLQFAHYITHKFPQLDLLIIDVQYADFSKEWKDHMFNKFINYISKTNSVSFSNLIWKEDSIGSFWEHASQSHRLEVEIYYTESTSSFAGCTDIEIDGKVCSHVFRYFSSSGVSQHSDITKAYGRNIDVLTLTGIESSMLDCRQEAAETPYEILILQPLKHCIRLKKLSVNSSILIGAKLLGDRFPRIQQFDSLRFNDCMIEDNHFYKSLSTIFTHVKFLELYGITRLNFTGDKNVAFRGINMKDTHIGTLSISNNSSRCYSINDRVLLLNVLIQQDQSFYIYDYDTMNDLVFKPVDKAGYLNKCNIGRCFRIGISCKSLEFIKVKQREREIILRVL